MDARLSPIVSHSLIPVVVIDDADSAPAAQRGAQGIDDLVFERPQALRADDDEADIDAFEHGARLADAQRAQFADIVKTGRIDKDDRPER